MGKIARATQQIFASSQGTDQMTQFGSYAAGSTSYLTPSTSGVIATIQNLAAYLTGWFGAIVGGGSPCIEDMNALFFLITYQLAYQFQAGVAEYDSGTTYYTGSLCNSNGQIYRSTADSSTGNAVTSGAYWSPMIWTPNLLLNGNFDFWQRATSTTVANGSSTYVADRWYVKNSLGTSGVITGSQDSISLSGSIYGAKVQITTAPTASQANGCELYQVLTHLDSLPLYGGYASFQAELYALGNVTQLGLQFFYATSEEKVTTAIGTEVLVTVSASAFTLGQILNQALGTSQTTSGVIGVRIRPTAVSSGNLYDLNNGFIVAQAMMSPGGMLGPFTRAGRNAADELAMCQKYYQKSYAQGVAVGTDLYAGSITYVLPYAATSATIFTSVQFKVSMRTTPTVTTYSPVSGASGTVYIGGPNSDYLASVGQQCAENFEVGNASGTTVGAAQDPLNFHWTADAEI